jgi:hypothetical protein
VLTDERRPVELGHADEVDGAERRVDVFRRERVERGDGVHRHERVEALHARLGSRRALRTRGEGGEDADVSVIMHTVLGG